MQYLISALPTSISQGLIWGLMAIGLYITNKILDISDREYRRMEKGEVTIYTETLSKLCDMGFDAEYLFSGRLSLDVYIERAYATMPDDMFEDNLKRINAIFQKHDLETVNGKGISKQDLSEVLGIFEELIRYGHDNYLEFSLPNREEHFNVFTDLFRKRIPKRIRRKDACSIE